MKQLVYIKATGESISFLQRSGLPERLIFDLLGSDIEVDENFNYTDSLKSVWSLPPEACVVRECSI